MEQLMKVCELEQHKGHLNWENISLTRSEERFFMPNHSKFLGRKAADFCVKADNVPMEDIVDAKDLMLVKICSRGRSRMEERPLA